MRTVLNLAVTVLIAAGCMVAAPTAASAHTPSISTSCDGVHVGATRYNADQANRWSVTVNGDTTTGTFGSTLDVTIPVPQDGATSTWSAYVEAANGGYHGEDSGTVGPCGTPPPPPVHHAKHNARLLIGAYSTCARGNIVHVVRQAHMASVSITHNHARTRFVVKGHTDHGHKMRATRGERGPWVTHVRWVYKLHAPAKHCGHPGSERRGHRVPRDGHLVDTADGMTPFGA